MIFLQASQNSFWYDQGVSVVSATVTLLAFIATFGILIYNSKKEKRESEYRSKKTLHILDFIFENNNEELEEFLKHMRIIRENPIDGISQVSKDVYGLTVVEQWRETRDQSLNIFFLVDVVDINDWFYVEEEKSLSTRFENNYITLQTYTHLHSKDFVETLNRYDTELKTSLINHHLNIKSDSIEIITDRMQAIKESLKIFNSIEVKDLIEIATYEQYKTEKEIASLIKKDPFTFINEEYERLVNLENELKKVIEPLSKENGGVTWVQRCLALKQSAMKKLLKK